MGINNTGVYDIGVHFCENCVQQYNFTMQECYLIRTDYTLEHYQYSAETGTGKVHTSSAWVCSKHLDEVSMC